MELDELKSLWGEYDKKLDKNLQLNMQLLRKINFDSARFRMRWLFVIKLSEMIFMACIFSYLAWFIFQHFSEAQFSIPALIIEAAIIACFILNVRMLATISELQLKDNNEPIAPLQKRVETLKLLIATYLKYALFLIPFYPLLMILMGKILLNIDFLGQKLLTYSIVNIVVGLGLLPFTIVVYKELSKKEITKNWVRNLLVGTGWHLANDAGGFLDQIEEFGKGA